MMFMFNALPTSFSGSGANATSTSQTSIGRGREKEYGSKLCTSNMRKLLMTVMCAILLLQTITLVSAQAQLPPPNYSLICDGQIRMDVDPETSTPPSEKMDCVVTNEESYALELSISSEMSGLSVEHDDSIVVGANSEETFQVTIDAENEMMLAAYSLSTSTEVTKTGEFDYSDDDPKKYNTMIEILQYAAYILEPQQGDNDQKLLDDEYFELTYTLTNKGNAQDKFSMNTYSYASRICDEEQTFETSNEDASGCVLSTPVSDDCDEELDVEVRNSWSKDWEKRTSMVAFLDVDQSVSITFKMSASVENSTCWPKNSEEDYHLEFTHVVRAYSDFGLRGWYDGDDDWGQYDHSPIRIERTVDVTKSNDEGILSSAIPGFESSYLLLCVFLAVIIHNRKNRLY